MQNPSFSKYRLENFHIMSSLGKYVTVKFEPTLLILLPAHQPFVSRSRTKYSHTRCVEDMLKVSSVV